jgi:hypothetical protein
MSSRSPLTVCLLCFGDELVLARRAGEHLLALPPSDVVRDYRLLFNSPSPALLAFSDELGKALVLKHRGVVHRYVAPTNRYKYPLMRRALYDPVRPCAPQFFWCDDDTYLAPPWTWDFVVDRLRTYDFIGQRWYRRLQDNQWQWIMTQPWFRPQAGRPDRLQFFQGSCWGIRTELLYRWNWPDKALRHCGGDSLLGELARQQAWTLSQLSHDYEHGAHINADLAGRHSKSPRRGYRELEFAADFIPGMYYSTLHQEFPVEISTYGSHV